LCSRDQKWLNPLLLESNFPLNKVRCNFFHGSQIALHRFVEERTEGLLRPFGRFCNRIATRARSFFATVQRLKAYCECNAKRGGGRWDPSFLLVSRGSRRSFPGIRYARRSCPQMISSMQLASLVP